MSLPSITIESSAPSSPATSDLKISLPLVDVTVGPAPGTDPRASETGARPERVIVHVDGEVPATVTEAVTAESPPRAAWIAVWIAVWVAWASEPIVIKLETVPAAPSWRRNC